MMKAALLASFGLVATSALALTDITPANYKFNNVNSISLHENVYGTSNFATPVWTTINGGAYFDDGLIVLCGNAAKMGTNGSTPKKITDCAGGKAVLAGTAIVDLGGEVGKVMAISGANSKINQAIKAYNDQDMNIPVFTENPGWFSYNFFANPENLPKDGSDSYRNIRCRLIYNIYQNSLEKGTQLASMCVTTDQGGTNGVASDGPTSKMILVNEDGDPVDYEGEFIEDDDPLCWDPNMWEVIEINMFVKPDEAGVTFSPVRLKLDMKADALDKATVFIKSVEFFHVTPSEAVNDGALQKSTITLAADPKPNSIADINANTVDSAAEYFNIQGQRVSNPGAGFYIVKRGSKVSKEVIR